MGLGLMVAVLIVMVVGTAAIEVSMIKNVFNKAKKAALGGMITKAIESKTGVDVKSLVDQKGFQTGVAGASLIGVARRVAKTVVGTGEVGLGIGATAGELFDRLTGRKISGVAKLASSGAKRFVRQKVDGAKETAGAVGNAIKGLIPETARKRIKGFTSQVKDDFEYNKRWIRDRKKSLVDFKNNIVNEVESTKGFELQKMGAKMIADAFHGRHHGLALRRPHADPILVNLGGTPGTWNQIRNLTGQNANAISAQARQGLENAQARRELLNSAVMQEGLQNTREWVDADTREKREIAKRFQALRGKLNNPNDYAQYRKDLDAYTGAVREFNRSNLGKAPTELINKMLDDIVKNSKGSLDQDKLADTAVEAYNTLLHSTPSWALREAKNNALLDEDYKKIARAKIDNAYSKLSKDERKAFEERAQIYGQSVKEFREDMLQRISTNPIGSDAKDLFGEEGAKQIAEKITAAQTSYINHAEVRAKDRIKKDYMDKYGVSIEEANDYLEKTRAGEIDQDLYQEALQKALHSTNNRTTEQRRQTVQQNTQVETQQIAQTPSLEPEQVTATQQETISPAQQTVGVKSTTSTPQQNQNNTSTQEMYRQAQELEAAWEPTTPATSGQQRQNQNNTNAQEMYRQAQELETTWEPTSARASTSTTHREVIKEQIIQKTINNNVSNRQTTVGLENSDIEKIANRVTAQTSPISDAVKKSVELFDKLGHGSIDAGIQRMADTIDNLSNGSSTNLTKAMEKMLKDLGSGNVTEGAKNVKIAIDNINKGTMNSVLGSKEQDELLYEFSKLIASNNSETVSNNDGGEFMRRIAEKNKKSKIRESKKKPA